MQYIGQGIGSNVGRVSVHAQTDVFTFPKYYSKAFKFPCVIVVSSGLRPEF